MNMMMSSGEQHSANRVFQSAQLFVFLICLMLFAIVVPVVYFIPTAGISGSDQICALIILVAGVLVSFTSGLSGAVFKATGRYPKGMALEVTARLAEWSGGIIGLILLGSYTAVAIGMIAVKLVSVVVMGFISTRGQRHLSWGMTQANWAEIREMIRPSFGFMMFPISNVLSLQGFTLLTAHTFGPAAVAIFNSYRTIARVTVQATAVLSWALWPEFTRLYGRGERIKLRKLLVRSSLLSAVGSVALSIMLYISAPYLIDAWTKGRLLYFHSLMGAFLAYAAIAGMAHIPRVSLMAINSHSKLGVSVLLITIGSLFIATVLGKSNGTVGFAVAMAMGEVASLCVCLWEVRRRLLEVAN
ncbi:lipopolysaccharide biosynthesis protein [Cupriavidus sp. CP313]